ncbi:uncharacterized protein LOC121737380 [Aricia agestis]|uniref:uncharacterized protein LOC121737380 n=1 Tax=Aricia agestis TaxID=91739 RepID=UPI001C208870|nr:uncharacterized protein LOC121737380 [Aricia agestis]
MACQCCTSGLAVSAVVAAVLLVPTHYYEPSAEDPSAGKPVASPDSQEDELASSLARADVVILAAFVTVTLTAYLCDWIQRKLMERRINKLNERLSASVSRLREWEERRTRQEASLRAVQAATSEYNLLLYLLLQRHRPPAASVSAPALDTLENERDFIIF